MVSEIELNQANFSSTRTVLTMSANSRLNCIDGSRSLKDSSGRNSMNSETIVCANGEFRSQHEPKKTENRNTPIELHSFTPKRKYKGN